MLRCACAFALFAAVAAAGPTSYAIPRELMSFVKDEQVMSEFWSKMPEIHVTKTGGRPTTTTTTTRTTTVTHTTTVTTTIASSTVAGLPNLSCTEICDNALCGCYEEGTTRINTSLRECVKAVQSVVPHVESRANESLPPQFPSGCSAFQTADITIANVVVNQNDFGAGFGCGANGGVNSLQSLAKICLCLC